MGSQWALVQGTSGISASVFTTRGSTRSSTQSISSERPYSEQAPSKSTTSKQ